MCVVSMVGDTFKDRWGPKFPDDWGIKPTPPFVPNGPVVPMAPEKPFMPMAPSNVPSVTRYEFDKLKQEVELLRELLIRAKAYDEKNGEPDCEMDDKIAFLKRVAEFVGVDLEEVFGK